MPPHMAAQYGVVDRLLTLNQLGVNLNTPDARGYTPAHVAAEFGHIGVLRALHILDAKLLNTPNAMGVTPAHIAAQCGHLEFVKELLTLPSTYTPAVLTIKYLMVFINNKPNEVKERLFKLIEQQIGKKEYQQEDEGTLISLLARDIAFIMGHQEIMRCLDSGKKKYGTSLEIYTPANKTYCTFFNSTAVQQEPRARQKCIYPDGN
jgi:ankyrin repeat protein